LKAPCMPQYSIQWPFPKIVCFIDKPITSSAMIYVSLVFVIFGDTEYCSYTNFG
jgi:hypothetical protein